LSEFFIICESGSVKLIWSLSLGLAAGLPCSRGLAPCSGCEQGASGRGNGSRAWLSGGAGFGRPRLGGEAWGPGPSRLPPASAFLRSSSSFMNLSMNCRRFSAVASSGGSLQPLSLP